MKIDPDKPFGDFYIDALIKSEGDSLPNYETRTPMLIDLKDPNLVIFKFSSKPRQRATDSEQPGAEEPTAEATLMDAPGINLQQDIETAALESENCDSNKEYKEGDPDEDDEDGRQQPEDY